MPATPIKPANAVIILTRLPNKSPMASAIDNLPKNSAMRGAKNQPISKKYMKQPITFIKIKRSPWL